MHDEWWLKFCEKILEILPAIGGAFVSLKSLPIHEKTFWGFIFALIGGVAAAVYGTDFFINKFDSLSKEKWNANLIMFGIGIFGMMIINVLVQAVKDVKPSDALKWLKEGGKAWVKRLFNL